MSLAFGISHVDLACTDLAHAARLYGHTLGFAEAARGEGWLDLDAGGTVLLRLVQVRTPEHRAALRVRCADVAATLQALVAAGCTPLNEPQRTPDQCLAGSVRDPDGHAITVWRPLTEDEFDRVPELPKQQAWADDADALLKQLLKGVPALFRPLARRKVVRVAESLAGAGRPVTREEVIRGFILASPRITRQRNRQPLLDAGVDLARYQADWDAD